MSPTIEVSQLTKQYRLQASPTLTEVSFSINEGEIIGLLGPNGAGKTTLVKLLCGIIPATSGQISVLGLDPFKEGMAAKQKIGVVHQRVTFDLFLSMDDNLAIAAAFYGTRWSALKPSADKLLELFQLTGCRTQPLFTLSGGQLRRLQVIRALLKRPRILILDEPSAGLDVTSRRDVWALLQKLRSEQGVTILWSSHYVEELERNCDRALVLKEGALAGFERVSTLVERYGCPRIVMQFEAAVEPLVLDALVALECGAVRGEESLIEIREYSNFNPLPVVLTTLQRLGLTPTDIKILPGSLEDAYLALTEGPAYVYDRLEGYLPA